jgi:hypothetical protein
MLVLYVLIGLFDLWVGPVPLDLAGLATRAQLDGMASCGGPVGADKTADPADFWHSCFGTANLQHHLIQQTSSSSLFHSSYLA